MGAAVIGLLLLIFLFTGDMFEDENKENWFSLLFLIWAPVSLPDGQAGAFTFNLVY